MDLNQSWIMDMDQLFTNCLQENKDMRLGKCAEFPKNFANTVEIFSLDLV